MVGMEAAAVKAAVSGTLNLVCNKLAPLVIKEYSSIVGVEKDLRELQDLALEINQRLEAAGDRATGDAPFLKKLKEAVYEVEDVVDEFQLKAEKYEVDGDGGFVSNLHAKPKSLIFQCQAARKIKKMFDVLVKQRNILNSVVDNDPVSHMNNIAVSKQTLPFVDETAVIGRDQEMNDILSELLQDDGQQRIKIVSIVGLGGSGKTTLAQLVFKKVETMENKKFTVKLWVHVSQEEFQLEKILKKLFEAISNERSEGLSLMSMANKILDRLTNKRFLLVLDDVWVENHNKWEELMVYLKNISSGSRILLTTRSTKVARTVESTTIVNLPLLSKDYSWQLFQQSFRNNVNDLGPEFEEIGKEIMSKCGGVPLAIKVFAGVLRDKNRVEQWHAIRHHNLLDVDDKEHQVSNCLWLSYFNLPSHLKQCFTICSIFPKGHLMDKDQLIDQWIAHNMVMGDGVNYLEYGGNDWFSHLVQIYFIQDVKDAKNGKVTCKMHDLVHDLSRSILGDEISLSVPAKTTNCTKICRYFSIMEDTMHYSPKNTFQKARAMYIAKDDDYIFGKASKKAKHLRSITVKNVHTSALTAILQTKNLRYLNISRLKHQTLPDVISEIWSLQALHVTLSDLVKLPESIGNKLQKLRVVNLSDSERLTSLPDSIGNCVMISTIDLFHCKNVATLPSSISRNKRLRVLRLGQTTLERLPSGITALENLECLDLYNCYELVELPEGIRNLKKLVVLNLKHCVKLRAIPKGIAQLTRLEMLGQFVMGEDNEKYAKISELENINKISGELIIHGIAHGIDPDVAPKEWLKLKTNLKSLTLICASDAGVNTENQLKGLEPPPGIKHLEIDGYSGQGSTQWMLKHRGAEVVGLPRFRLLSKLELSNFPKLERLEGLTELPCLEELSLRYMDALRSISGGPFPSLSRLFMYEMPSLGVVWMVTDRSLADLEGGELQIGNRLSALTIAGCPKLMVMPYFPLSLKGLYLVASNVQLLGLPGLGQGSSLTSFSYSCLKELYLSDMEPPVGSRCQWELLQHLTALEVLRIYNCDGLTNLPESMRNLASLRTMLILTCQTLCMLPEWLGELQDLERMTISGCSSLSPAPSIQPLRALKELYIEKSGWVGDLCCPFLQTLQINSWVGDLCCPSLQTLKIVYCDSISLPQSFRQHTSLTTLEINGCHDIRELPECLRELPSLQMLKIWGLSRLSSLPQSLGYLTSLQELHIIDCDALAQLPECVGELRSLRVFEISTLQSLTCLPQSLGCLTSLQKLEIESCEALGQLPDCFGELHSLRVFRISNFWRRPCLPQSLRCQFRILNLLGLTCLPQSLERLTSLQQLEINCCKALSQLPESLGELCSLKKFVIWNLRGLTSFPESMCCLTSLEQFKVGSCPGIKSLPPWIKGLTALQTLEIHGCPDLEKRCERRKGKDWHLISHIPHLWIGWGRV